MRVTIGFGAVLLSANFGPSRMALVFTLTHVLSAASTAATEEWPSGSTFSHFDDGGFTKAYINITSEGARFQRYVSCNLRANAKKCYANKINAGSQ